jgi:amidase
MDTSRCCATRSSTGCDREGLPIGVPFYGNFCREDLLLEIAAQIERARPEWFADPPPLHVGMGVKALRGIE